MSMIQIPTLELELPRCVHGLSGPCKGTKLKRRYCKTLFTVRRWLMRKDRQGWTRLSVMAAWCLIVAFTVLMFAAAVSVYGTARSPVEDRIALAIASCARTTGQDCQIELVAKPIPSSNYKF